jgi:hypothetical protein
MSGNGNTYLAESWRIRAGRSEMERQKSNSE